MTKEEFKKDFNVIYEGHRQNLLACHEKITKEITNPLPYLISYLTFMRDYYLLTTPDDLNDKNLEMQINALFEALESYDKYEEAVAALKQEGLKEEEKEAITKEGAGYYINFWQLVANNMGRWLPNDA